MWSGQRVLITHFLLNAETRTFIRLCYMPLCLCTHQIQHSCFTKSLSECKTSLVLDTNGSWLNFTWITVWVSLLENLKQNLGWLYPWSLSGFLKIWQLCSFLSPKPHYCFFWTLNWPTWCLTLTGILFFDLLLLLWSTPPCLLDAARNEWETWEGGGLNVINFRKLSSCFEFYSQDSFLIGMYTFLCLQQQSGDNVFFFPYLCLFFCLQTVSWTTGQIVMKLSENNHWVFVHNLSFWPILG